MANLDTYNQKGMGAGTRLGIWYNVSVRSGVNIFTFIDIIIIIIDIQLLAEGNWLKGC